MKAQEVSILQEPVKVLIVDDKVANLLALENVLKGPGLEIIRARSGNEALATLLESDFACILLDVNMPEMDGFELARIIRDDNHTKFVPIIFVSAYQKADSDVFKGYETGAIDYLVKPLDPVIVRSKVAILADLYRHKKALERTKEMEALNRHLADLNQKLQSANDDLRHFTQMAAHDLKEPIRSQRNLLVLLQEDLKGIAPTSTESLLAFLDVGLQKMTDMIDSFRALTGIDYKEIYRTHVNLRTLIDRCLETYADRIFERKVTIKYDAFPDDVSVYHILISILYDKLIKNTFDHVHTDAFTIHFTAEQDQNKKWTFGVMNTGSRIEESFQSEVFKMRRTFDPLYKEGSGIGLAICKRIVDRHGGTIKVGSDRETVHFKFTLEAQ